MNPSELLVKFRERWAALSRIQRIVVVTASIGVLIAVAYLGQMVMNPGYAPLFTELDPKDAGRISNELQEMKIPYRVTGEGKTIEVPEKLVYETRIKLASSGALYSSGVGFELFDESKFGVTDFEQQVGYQRALQEELRRTITQLEAVEQARVHLVIPKQSLFMDDEVSPSASIALKLKSIARLEPAQVRGIADLVMGSVQGIQPENIHIIDMEGNILSDNIAAGDDASMLNRLTMDQFQFKRNYEKELETRIHSMLRRILGPNKAVTMVTADLNFDQQQSQSTTYDPDKQVLSEHALTEEGSGGTGASGVPGQDSSQPGSTIPALAGATGSEYSKEETTTNYQVGSRQETLVKSPGELRRLSVAVVVNGNYPKSELLEIESVVKAAIGFSEERLDQVAISNMNFDTSELEQSAAEMAAQLGGTSLSQRLGVAPWVLYVSGALIALVAVALLVIYRRRLARERREAELMAQAQEVGEETEEREPFIPDMKESATIQEDLRKFAGEKPQDVAEVIKLWMKE